MEPVSYTHLDVYKRQGGNYNPDNYRIYFRDTGLLIGSLDEEAQEDLRNNKNFNTYKGAIYENMIADMQMCIRDRVWLITILHKLYMLWELS